MIKTSLDLLWKSLAIIGYIFGNLQKHSSGLRKNFGQPLEIFRRSEIFGKMPKMPLCIVIILYTKTKITWSLGEDLSTQTSSCVNCT